MSKHPYQGLPDNQFWARAVATLPPDNVDPVVEAPFTIAQNDKVATAGSCFAQHISKALAGHGFSYLVTECGPAERNFGVFSARFGNIYTVRQLLQLFDRAYGLFAPREDIWRRDDGVYVDPFRPQVEPAGFATVDVLRTDRAKHFSAVREMFETSDVFVFTLGLTEGWVSSADGATYPLAPGVSGVPEDGSLGAEFKNFSVTEMVSDFNLFIERLRAVNLGVRILLTVSPVPLVATFERKHVLVSTIYSKSALRVVAEMVSRSNSDVAYFPSYEIITGPHNGNRYFEADLRSVRQSGVDNVMRLFFDHYAKTGAASAYQHSAVRTPSAAIICATEELNELSRIVCDEEALEG